MYHRFLGMRWHVIFTLNRPFKRRVHNNYWSFPTIDGGDGLERPKAPISQHLDALEVPTLSTHGREQFYCHQNKLTRGRTPTTSAERGRRRRPLKKNLRGALAAKTARVRRPSTLLRNSAGVATSCTDSRSFLCASIQIARYHRLQAGGAGVPGVLAVARAAA